MKFATRAGLQRLKDSARAWRLNEERLRNALGRFLNWAKEQRETRRRERHTKR